MAADKLGKQAAEILRSPKVIATAIAGGGLGLAGGAIINGQKAEESGAPLSGQALSTFGGGVVGGLGGTALSYGGAVALSAAKRVIGKK